MISQALKHSFSILLGNNQIPICNKGLPKFNISSPICSNGIPICTNGSLVGDTPKIKLTKGLAEAFWLEKFGPRYFGLLPFAVGAGVTTHPICGETIKVRLQTIVPRNPE